MPDAPPAYIIGVPPELLCLEVGRFGRAGEGDYVADVLHASDEEDETLEAETEARVGA